MAKILKMNLYYKGKELNYVTSTDKLKSDFYIGSNKHLFWQILEKSFPDKQKFVSKKGNKYVAYLSPKMKVNIEKNDKQLSMAELKSQKILQGNELYLTSGMRGAIAVAEDWEVKFKFFQYKPKTISKDELRLIKKYATWSPLKSEEKFTRIFLFLAFLVTLAGAILFENMWVPPVTQLSFTDFTEEAMGVSVEDWIDNKIPEAEEGVTEGKEVEETPKVEEKEVKNEATPTKEEKVAAAQASENASTNAEIDDFLGSLGDDITEGVEEDNTDLFNTSGNDIFAVNELTELTAKAVGGPGSNSNKSKSKTVRNDFDNDVGDIIAGNIGDDALDAGLGDLFNTSQVEEMTGGEGFGGLDIGTFDSGIGEVGKVVTITPSKMKAKIAAAKKRMAAVKAVSEEEITSGDIEIAESSSIGIVRSRIKTFKNRILKIYNTQFQFSDMYGALKITLFISPNSVIGEVIPEPNSKFDATFLKAVKEDIAAWKFPVSEDTQYTFILPLTK